MEENNITQREQLFIITTAIILAGMAANYSTISPSIILDMPKTFSTTSLMGKRSEPITSKSIRIMRIRKSIKIIL